MKDFFKMLGCLVTKNSSVTRCKRKITFFMSIIMLSTVFTPMPIVADSNVETNNVVRNEIIQFSDLPCETKTQIIPLGVGRSGIVLSATLHTTVRITTESALSISPQSLQVSLDDSEDIPNLEHIIAEREVDVVWLETPVFYDEPGVYIFTAEVVGDYIVSAVLPTIVVEVVGIAETYMGIAPTSVLVSGTCTCKAIAISAGASHAMALRENGTVWTWGHNFSGQLGNGESGTASPGTAVSSNVPVQATNNFSSKVVAISAGGSAPTNNPNNSNVTSFSLALTEEGYVYSWGSSGNGRLGRIANVTTPSTQPHRIPTLGPGTTGPIKAIAAGETHALALTEDGRVFAWGSGAHGRLGNGTTSNQNSPISVTNLNADFLTNPVVSIAAGHSHSLAIKEDGTVWAWGKNDDGTTLNAGQLGDNTNVNSDVPVLVFQNANLGLGGNIASTNVTGNRNILTAGGNFSMVLRNDGRIASWGRNASGQLGNGSVAAMQQQPVLVVNTNLTNDIVAISADRAVQTITASNHSLALRGDGTVWAWGEQSNGRLGNGINTSASISSPIQVTNPNINNIVAVSAGGGYSLALKADGTIWSWGHTVHGVLGDGGTFGLGTNRAPVMVQLVTPITAFEDITRDHPPQLPEPAPPIPGQVIRSSLTDIDWTIRDSPGFDEAYTRAASRRFNGFETPNHVVITGDALRFFGYGLAPKLNMTFSENPANGSLSSIRVTKRPVVMNFHTFSESGILFGGRFVGNTYTGYALILKSFPSVSGNNIASLQLYYLHNEVFDFDSFTPGTITTTRTLLGTFRTGITDFDTQPYDVEIDRDLSTGDNYIIYLDGAEVATVPSAGYTGFGFYTGYFGHFCPVLTVMQFENVEVSLADAIVPTRERTTATVHFVDEVTREIIGAPQTKFLWDFNVAGEPIVGEYFYIDLNVLSTNYTGTARTFTDGCGVTWEFSRAEPSHISIDMIEYNLEPTDNVITLLYRATNADPPDYVRVTEHFKDLDGNVLRNSSVEIVDKGDNYEVGMFKLRNISRLESGEMTTYRYYGYSIGSGSVIVGFPPQPAITNLQTDREITLYFVRDVKLTINYVNESGASIGRASFVTSIDATLPYFMPVSHTNSFGTWNYTGGYRINGVDGVGAIPTSPNAVLTAAQLLEASRAGTEFVITLVFTNNPAVTVQFREYQNEGNILRSPPIRYTGTNFAPMSISEISNAINNGVVATNGINYALYRGYTANNIFYADIVPPDMNVAENETIILHFSASYTVTEKFHNNETNHEVAAIKIMPDVIMTLFGGESFAGNPPATISDGFNIWNYIGYKEANDSNPLMTGVISPISALAGDATFIYVYEIIGAITEVTVTERFREHGNTSNVLEPDNPLKIQRNANYDSAIRNITDYTYVGWFLDNETTLRLLSQSPGSVISPVTQPHTITYLYISSGPESYTITFDGNSGLVLPENESRIITFPQTTLGSNMPLANPTRDGYSFKDWNTKADGTGTVFTAATIVTGDIIVYAQWEEIPVGDTNYTVTFDGNGGLPASVTRVVVENTAVGIANMPPDPTQTGYNFLGWNTEADGSGTVFTAATIVTGDIIVYAQWEEIPVGDTNYTVTFDGNGGLPLLDTRVVIENAAVGVANMPPNPTRGGHRFLGWNTKADGTGTVFTATTIVTESITVFARWDAIVVVNPPPPIDDGDDNYTTPTPTPTSPPTISKPEPTPTPEPTEVITPEIPMTEPLEVLEFEREIHLHRAYVFGYPDGTVRPYGNTTRQEAATMFYNLMMENMSNARYVTDYNSFVDVQPESWSNRSISTLVNAGIIEGYPGNEFRPENNITRAEFATLLLKYYEFSSDSSSFSDYNTETIFDDVRGHWAERK